MLHSAGWVLQSALFHFISFLQLHPAAAVHCQVLLSCFINPAAAAAAPARRLDLLVSTMNGNLYAIATAAAYHPLKTWTQQSVGGGTFTARCEPPGGSFGLPCCVGAAYC